MTLETKAEEKTLTARPRLDYLDGLRGLAALYVILHHAYMCMIYYKPESLPSLLLSATSWLQYGRLAVATFIVLSGFCLMIPVIRSKDKKVHGGNRIYFKRRARRILPPYYIALLLSSVLYILMPALKLPGQPFGDRSLPAYTTEALIAHLFLIHNLKNEWAFAINAPM